jgi:hypothetical protein
MAISRNFALIALMMVAAIALAIGVTIARAIVNHGAVVSTTSVTNLSMIPSVHHDI